MVRRLCLWIAFDQRTRLSEARTSATPRRRKREPKAVDDDGCLLELFVFSHHLFSLFSLCFIFSLSLHLSPSLSHTIDRSRPLTSAASRGRMPPSARGSSGGGGGGALLFAAAALALALLLFLFAFAPRAPASPPAGPERPAGGAMGTGKEQESCAAEAQRRQ